MTTNTSVLDDIKQRSGWSMFMGVLTAALGILLIVYPFAAATLTTVFLGGTLILVGAAGLVLALASQSAGSFITRVLLALLYGFVGIALVAFPFQGVASLTLFVGAAFVVRGVIAGVAAFRLRPVPGWGWLLADGFSSLLAGGLILAKWPSSSLWAVGTLVGVSVLVTGCSRTALAARIRQGTKDVERLAQRPA